MTALTVMTGGNNRVMAENRLVKEIPFSALEGVRVGNAQDNTAKTGVTVLCFPAGAKTGVDISGGGPASRETPVLDPTKENIGIHAIVLSGGSAYGLAAEVMAKAIENAVTASRMEDQEYLSHCPGIAKKDDESQ